MRRFNLFVLTLVCLSALAAFSGGIQSGVDSLHRWRNLSDVPSTTEARDNLSVPSHAQAVATMTAHEADQSTHGCSTVASAASLPTLTTLGIPNHNFITVDSTGSTTIPISLDIPGTAPQLRLRSSVGQGSTIYFRDTVNRWALGRDGSNNFTLYNYINGRFSFFISSSDDTASFTGNVQIGTGTITGIGSSRLSTFDNNTSSASISLIRFSDNTTSPIIRQYKSRGDVTASSPVLAGDNLGTFSAWGNNGQEFVGAGTMGWRAAENFSSSGAGTCFNLYSTLIGTTTASLRLRIGCDGTASFTGGIAFNGGVDLVASEARVAAHELDSSTHNCGTVASLGANIFAEDQKIGPNATLSLKYDASDSNRSTLGWSHIQLGNNALNRIIGGRTNAGGGLSFYVNSTLDYTYDTIDGSEAMRIDSDADVDINYNLFVAGNVQGASQVASATALSDHNLAVAVHGVTVVASETRIADHELDSSTHNCGTIASLGANIFTGNQALNGNWLSGDGGNEGVYVDSAGNVGIATTTPPARFTINSTSGSPNYGIIWGSQGGGFTSGSPFQFVTTSYSDPNPLFLIYDQTSGQVAGQDLFGVRNSSGSYVLVAEQSGFVGILTNAPTEALTVVGNASMSGGISVTTIPEYADNAAAISGGLAVGQFYRTSDTLKVVHH